MYLPELPSHQHSGAFDDSDSEDFDVEALTTMIPLLLSLLLLK